jgi:hypothetical protein
VELRGQNYTPATVFLGKNFGSYLIGNRVGHTKVLDGFGEDKSCYAKRVLKPVPSILYKVTTPALQNKVKKCHFFLSTVLRITLHEKLRDFLLTSRK